jgi:hypothetical protein
MARVIFSPRGRAAVTEMKSPGHIDETGKAEDNQGSNYPYLHLMLTAVSGQSSTPAVVRGGDHGGP